MSIVGGGGGEIRPFFMEDVVQIINGVRLTKADMTVGHRPFVGLRKVLMVLRSLSATPTQV